MKIPDNEVCEYYLHFSISSSTNAVICVENISD